MAHDDDTLQIRKAVLDYREELINYLERSKRAVRRGGASHSPIPQLHVTGPIDFGGGQIVGAAAFCTRRKPRRNDKRPIGTATKDRRRHHDAK
jgi:hypothetical protein